MKQIIAGLTVILICLGVVGCGGEDAVSETQTEAAAKSQQANNPLADQQQLIRDAQAIQGVLDADADAKKKAVSEAN